MVKSEIYRERVLLAPWVSLLFGLIMGIMAVMIYVKLYFGINLGRKTSSTALLLGEAVLILVYLVCRRLDISIDPERVEVRFGIIRKTIPIEEIVSCEPTHAGFAVGYGRVGISYGIDGSMAFTTSYGDAVKIRKRKGRPFVFSTNRPFEVSEHINRLIIT